MTSPIAQSRFLLKTTGAFVCRLQHAIRVQIGVSQIAVLVLGLLFAGMIPNTAHADYLACSPGNSNVEQFLNPKDDDCISFPDYDAGNPDGNGTTTDDDSVISLQRNGTTGEANFRNFGNLTGATDPLSFTVNGFTVTGSGPGKTIATQRTTTTVISDGAAVTKQCFAPGCDVEGTHGGVAFSFTYIATSGGEGTTRPTVGPPALATASPPSQSQTVSTAFADALQVTVTDAGGNPVSGVVVNFTTPMTGASATLSAASATTNASGIASVTATANSTVGAYTVTASSAGLTAVSFNLSNFEVIAPALEITGPTGVVTDVFTVNFGFSEPVTGFAETDIVITGGTAVAGTFGGSGAAYSIVIDPDLGQLVTVSVAQGLAFDTSGNPNDASNVYSVQAGSPETAFSANEDEIRLIVRNDTRRRLENEIAFNQRITRDARTRFRDRSADMAVGGTLPATRNSIPFDVNGTLEIVGKSARTQGSFFAQTDDWSDTRRLIFGEFDIRRDEDGSSTYTLNADVAWERMLSEQALLGYYLGAQASQSQIEGDFEGSASTFGIAAGAYMVADLSSQVTADGFVAVSAARTSLELSDSVLDLSSDYDTTSIIVGGSVSGVVPLGKAELEPELSFVTARALIGDVGFVGQAYGLTDDSLNLDAGKVTLSNVMFRPEWRTPLGRSLDDAIILKLAPKVFCEWLDEDETCNSGADIGFSYASPDGASVFDVLFSANDVHNVALDGVQFSFEHRF